MHRSLLLWSYRFHGDKGEFSLFQRGHSREIRPIYSRTDHTPMPTNSARIGKVLGPVMALRLGSHEYLLHFRTFFREFAF